MGETGIQVPPLVHRVTLTGNFQRLLPFCHCNFKTAYVIVHQTRVQHRCMASGARKKGEIKMYLPDIFKRFMEQYPEIADAYRRVGDLSSQSGPLEQRAQHLIQLGISIGTGSRGGVRSHARRALESGVSREEILQVVLLSMTIIGFPAMIAAFNWVEEMFDAIQSGKSE
jgi:4-carboxymuconolactone decarboxylase